MKIKNALLIASLLSISACAKSSNLIQERQQTAAPQSEKDVGVLLDGAQEAQVNALLAAHPEAKVRTLNAPHGLYEIFGVASVQVRREFSGRSEPNQFFTVQKNRRPALAGAQLLAVPAPAGLQVGILKACVDNGHGPDAQVTAELPIATLDGATIALGQKVRLNSLKSTANVAAPGALTTQFDVALPEMAAHPELLGSGNTFEFTPDTLGAYQVFTIVQDVNSACSVSVLRFVVTSNQPFNGPTPPDLTLDLGKFTHLGMVHAADAWKVSQGDGVVIAIVDTGVNYNHQALSQNMYINHGEIPANGIDDDKNGFIDDYIGYDFANQDAYPYDDEGHGTHVAGLAAGIPFGLAPHAKILAVKAMTPAGGDIGAIAAAIRYAVDRGANIINLSIGAQVPQAPAVLLSAMTYAQSKGVLIISAAGNGDQSGIGFDIDAQPVFPASVALDNNLAVAAFDSTEVLASYSNFGAKAVGVVAPGGGASSQDLMYSSAFENPQGSKYVGMSGTSMAAPVTAGIAAQVWSKAKHLTYKEVRAILLSAGPDEAALKTVTISGKHLDSLSAVMSPADN